MLSPTPSPDGKFYENSNFLMCLLTSVCQLQEVQYIEFKEGMNESMNAWKQVLSAGAYSIVCRIFIVAWYFSFPYLWLIFILLCVCECKAGTVCVFSIVWFLENVTFGSIWKNIQFVECFIIIKNLRDTSTFVDCAFLLEEWNEHRYDKNRRIGGYRQRHWEF